MHFSAVIVVLQYYTVLFLFVLWLSQALSYRALSFLNSLVCMSVTQRVWTPETFNNYQKTQENLYKTEEDKSIYVTRPSSKNRRE